MHRVRIYRWRDDGTGTMDGGCFINEDSTGWFSDILNGPMTIVIVILLLL